MTENGDQIVAFADDGRPGPAMGDRPAHRPPVDFVVIGAMRAGTTTLHEMLSRHPQIAMSRNKETDFFVAEKNLKRGLGWYLSQFDEDRPIRGEISPNYSKARDFPGVPERLAQVSPDARLIYVVRDPVARALSQYAHSWHVGDLTITPAETVASGDYDSLIDISSYARQLDHWHGYFQPSQVLVVDFDRLISDPPSQIERVLDHVGAARHLLGAAATRNDGAQLSRVPRSLMRLARGPLRPLLTAALSQSQRDRLRRVSAIGPQRQPPAFPDYLVARMRADLSADAHRFRQMTGMDFDQWSI